MITTVCAIRDRAADVFGQPFFTASTSTAIRSFTDLVNDNRDGNMISSHPEDFDLFYLGTYDDKVPKFHMLDIPSQIAIGKDCVKQLPSR